MSVDFRHRWMSLIEDRKCIRGKLMKWRRSGSNRRLMEGWVGYRQIGFFICHQQTTNCDGEESLFIRVDQTSIGWRQNKSGQRSNDCPVAPVGCLPTILFIPSTNHPHLSLLRGLWTTAYLRLPFSDGTDRVTSTLSPTLIISQLIKIKLGFNQTTLSSPLLFSHVTIQWQQQPAHCKWKMKLNDLRPFVVSKFRRWKVHLSWKERKVNCAVVPSAHAQQIMRSINS